MAPIVSVMVHGAGREVVVLVSFVYRGRHGRRRPGAYWPKRQQRRRLFISLEERDLRPEGWKVAQVFGYIVCLASPDHSGA